MRTQSLISLMIAVLMASVPIAATAQRSTRVAAPPPLVQLPSPRAPARVTVSNGGEAIVIDGALEAGTATRFETVVTGAPAARIVVLHSPGGMLGEAERIAATVRSRRLDTYVESACLSACTVILIAGRDRAASPNARIGFHHPRFPFSNAERIRSATALTRRMYDDAGVISTFTDRVLATPFEDMWYPTFQEMRTANVITRQTLGGETSAVLSQVSTIDQLRSYFLAVPFWRTIFERYPDIGEQALSAVWAARGRGLNDNEAISAGRIVVSNNLHRILASATDEILDEYFQLSIDQLRAARDLSFQACALYVQGRLNVFATLPRELATRETDIMTRILALPPQSLRHIDLDAVTPLFEQLTVGMSQEQIDVLADPDGEASPSLRCEASIAFFDRIAHLEPARRHQMVRYLFQSASEQP